jgi:hypothetical protein
MFTLPIHLLLRLERRDIPCDEMMQSQHCWCASCLAPRRLPASDKTVQGDPISTRIYVRVLSVQGLSAEDKAMGNVKDRLEPDQASDTKDGVSIEINNPFTSVRFFFLSCSSWATVRVL